MSNETIIIPKTQWNFDFWNLQGKEIDFKNGEFVKSGVKLQCLTEERETTFGYWEVRKNEGLRNQGSTVVILKRHILLTYDFNRQPGKIRNL